MIITLSPQDAIVPASIGLRRQIFALANGLRHFGAMTMTERQFNSAADNAFDHHILAAMSEYVVARALNLFWEPSVGNTNGVDVGGLVQVRLRRVPGTGSDLAIRDKDIDDKPYVLVHYPGGLTFELKGWLFGREGKGRGQFNEQKNVWFVPPPYRSIDELLEWVQGK